MAAAPAQLETLIGQLFMLGFKGTSIDSHHPIVEDLRERNLGGVVLFDRLLAEKREENNISSPAQVRALTQTLQEFSATPLLIAIDQEGGMVRRLKAGTGFPETESAGSLGSADDPTRTALHAACTAQTLHRLGINLNLAPVVDLDTHPQNPVIGKLMRSFSASAESVIRHAGIWIREHSREKVFSCLKHFPGHGSSQDDSHLGFTDISDSWQEQELLPFRSLIGDGLVHTVMLGHLFHEKMDPKYPTSLSPAVVNSLLRTQLGFEGLVLTDDLQMKAITDRYGLEEAACLALAAGVDMILIGNNLEYIPDILQRLVPAVVRAVREKRISETQIHRSLKRVEKLKQQLAPQPA